jgi:hypothetical protein
MLLRVRMHSSNGIEAAQGRRRGERGVVCGRLRRWKNGVVRCESRRWKGVRTGMGSSVDERALGREFSDSQRAHSNPSAINRRKTAEKRPQTVGEDDTSSLTACALLQSLLCTVALLCTLPYELGKSRWSPNREVVTCVPINIITP